MNKSLAIVKAREVCHVHRFSSIGAWHVQCPTDLADIKSELTSHPCDSYAQAVQWCAQAVARVALNLVKPDLNEEERRAVYGYMRNNQLNGFSSSAQQILREGLRYVDELRGVNTL